MKNKKIIILTIITVITLLTSITGATYAYFTAVRFSENKTNLKVYTASHDQTLHDGTNVFLEVDSINMYEEGSSNNYDSFNSSPTPGILKLETIVGSSGGTNTCTYDVVYTPIIEGSIQPYYRSKDNIEGLKEFTLDVFGEVEGSTAIINGEKSKEVDLTDVDKKIILMEGVSLSVYGKNAKGTAIWKITPKFYNLAINQADNADKIFGGKVTIENLKCYNDLNT